ncbi:hypothetical protein EJ07DRAFT_114520 [Lizonia empirigonia]|nr:hypothetical protein EJ07DRAFT_114520 [Lizonia empirigonia]
MEHQTPGCANCKKTAVGLRACSRCHTVQYCGRDCQKADWKTHKKACSTSAQQAFVEGRTRPSGSESTPRLRNLEKHIPNPFTRLDQGVYLHDRPEADVFMLLIDSFRMRQADDYDFEMKTTPPSIYTGASSSIEPFRQYLSKAATAGSLLPLWWTDAKVEECAVFGESGAWSDLRKKATKSDITNHYGDGKMPMQLRMLAETVYGCGTMGQDGSGARRLMMQMENGGSDQDQILSMLSLR